jgi:hypothetical protein
MTIDNTDLPEHFQEVFDRLENIKKDVHDLAVTLLLEGELKPLPNTPLGETYPYDFNLYVKDSFDPDVQALSNLIDKIDETIAAIRENKV